MWRAVVRLGRPFRERSAPACPRLDHPRIPGSVVGCCGVGDSPLVDPHYRGARPDGDLCGGELEVANSHNYRVGGARHCRAFGRCRSASKVPAQRERNRELESIPGLGATARRAFEGRSVGIGSVDGERVRSVGDVELDARAPGHPFAVHPVEQGHDVRCQHQVAPQAQDGPAPDGEAGVAAKPLRESSCGSEQRKHSGPQPERSLPVDALRRVIPSTSEREFSGSHLWRRPAAEHLPLVR